MSGYVIEGAYVVTVTGEEYPDGHVVVDGNRITAVGAGPAPDRSGRTVVDGRGCLLTPGFVNTHNHLFQWVTRGLAVDNTLFEWLTALYPVWAGLDEHAVHTSASGALAQLALTGCTTASDHHYLFPRDGGDVLGAGIRAAQEVGLRFHATRGSMDLGQSKGGLPPDHVTEDIDAVLAASQVAIDRWHDPSPDALVRVALAPCSPFSVTGDLMRASAELARDRGVLLHTHLAETLDEEDFCREKFGCTPVEYVERLGWTGEDVWFAHAIHLADDAVKLIGDTRTGVAHCPSSNARLGAGIARTRDLRAAGARAGLGVDGAASNEAGSLLEEARHAVLFARAVGGPTALSVRDGLELATIGGAAVLGRAGEIGSIEPGKLADLALWRIDGLGHADVHDPVAALVLGAPPPLQLLLVDGRPVVEQNRVVTVDTDAIARECTAVHRRLLEKTP
ncbi:8-oxoguanine deaminase [Pseudonocardia thermophila]|uniref:8-oxoguanine deaminase n=1 Tax=Pseudonocardia thermophila TaxID=1848 RepID=UPI00248F2BF9|nr:8-oxoguanine deaminase [Pseudonocardia thermophila]